MWSRPPSTPTSDQRLPPTRASDRICIGWSGSTTTIEHFRHAIPALRTLRERYGERVAFTVIGDADYRCRDLDVEALPWHRDTELEDLSTFDIGIMPLPDDPWARGKCGLKGLQDMALEIPTVMSPVGVNQEIIVHGENGLLAGSHDEWVHALSTLVESADLRRRLGSCGPADRDRALFRAFATGHLPVDLQRRMRAQRAQREIGHAIAVRFRASRSTERRSSSKRAPCCFCQQTGGVPGARRRRSPARPSRPLQQSSPVTDAGLCGRRRVPRARPIGLYYPSDYAPYAQTAVDAVTAPRRWGRSLSDPLDVAIPPHAAGADARARVGVGQLPDEHAARRLGRDRGRTRRGERRACLSPSWRAGASRHDRGRRVRRRSAST